MPVAVVDSIATRYEVVGSGPPLVLFAPGGFDATIEKWTSLGVYAKTQPVSHLSQHFTCVLFDRRECGQSGGRVERLDWSSYVKQAVGLMDHLKIERAHLMGGCLGCAPALATAIAKPERTLSLVEWWPVGGANYRTRAHGRFATHHDFVRASGLNGVVDLVRAEGKSFGEDPRGGPWASVIRNDESFADGFLQQDIEVYLATNDAIPNTLFDRDTAPGATPEQLAALRVPTLVIPGNDDLHATVAADYLADAIPGAEYWRVSVEEQTEDASAERLLTFLGQGVAA
jgi:pimeloyl-ACP methyl ester carboxylesterase